MRSKKRQIIVSIICVMMILAMVVPMFVGALM